MSIPEETIERVREASDIVGVIREYAPDLKRAGRSWKARCPFHNEKTPSFIVSPEKGIFKCFGCGAAGDIFKFLMLIENLTWIEAVKKLATKNSIEIKESRTDNLVYSQKAKLYSLLESASLFYNRCLEDSPKGKRALDYLQKRGVNNETIERFRLGFAPAGFLLPSAIKKGLSQKDILDAGIITRTSDGSAFEYMSERVVFPIFDASGRVIAFGGRTLDDSRTPKYLNTPETSVYSKSANLYGLFQTLPSLRKERTIILLEGYMDVVIPQQFGVSGAVASLGTSFTRQQAKLIARYADKVILLFDSDSAGIKGAQRALEILAEEVSLDISVASLPDKIDADEYLNKYGKDKFLELISKNSKNIMDFMIDTVLKQYGKDSPSDKVKTTSALIDFISKSPNEIIRREWIRKTSQKIDVAEDYFIREIKKRKSTWGKSSYYNVENKSDDSKHLALNKLSLEETLLNLVLNSRDLLSKISSDIFTDERCRKTYDLAAKGLNDADILTALPEYADWFSDLSLKFSSQGESSNKDENDIKASDLDRFDTIMRDLKNERLKRELLELEKEIKSNTEIDKDKIEKYKILVKQLKGTNLKKSSAKSL